MRTKIELLQQQVELMEDKLYVQIQYERGFWHYLLYELPSEKDIEFAKSGECEDGDLWLDSNLINHDWYEKEYNTFFEALESGIDDALTIFPN